MRNGWILFGMSLLLAPLLGMGQVVLSGAIVDAEQAKPLPHVHVVASGRGTYSLRDGSFTLSLPSSARLDSLSFSLVGYHTRRVSVQQLRQATPILITLTEQTTLLPSLVVKRPKLVEKKFGIHHRSPLIHFTDGMFAKASTFEIGQLIHLGKSPAQLTSLQLYLAESRPEPARFRIRMYRLEQGQPTTPLWESPVFEQVPIHQGWLRFDLEDNNLFLKGSFLATLEFLSDATVTRPIAYEIKLGGRSKSFYRRKGSSTWNTPPHHYCLFVTARMDPSRPEEEDPETLPSFSMVSRAVSDTFQLFIRLPEEYHSNPHRFYPVRYVLDANAYLDQVGDMSSSKKNPCQCIIAGIGYKDAYVMDSLRVRDYTFPAAPAADSLAISGGGERFYSFITTELIPEIDRRYRTDTTQRTLLGHSFGGYFTLYALLRQHALPPVFHTFIAASPSISYARGDLTQQFQRIHPTSKAWVYITWGEAEGSIREWDDFTQLLKINPSYQVHSKLYKDLDHLGTAVPSFQEGLQRMPKK